LKTTAFFFLFLSLLLAGCESIPSNAPPISAALLRAGTREHASGEVLAEGRSLFLNRCIQCHALPEIHQYSAERLREVLGTMSGRANLSASQHDAVLKYLLTVRSI